MASRPGNSRHTLTAEESLAQSAEMFELRASGWAVTDIAKKFECSAANVSTRISRYRRTLPKEKTAERRADVDHLYRRQLRRVEDIIEYGPIPAYSHGRAIAVAWNENGDPTEFALDYGHVLKGIDTSLKILAAVRQMYGLDEPVKVEQSGTVTFELVGVDMGDV